MKINLEKIILINTLGGKYFETTLLYQTYYLQFNAREFHRLCDNKGPTITLCILIDGQVVGGFTNADWTSPDEAVFVKDSKAVLFNLTAETSFPVN